MSYKNTEKQSEYLRKWRQAHPNYLNTWRLENKDHVKKYNLSYQRAHRNQRVERYWEDEDIRRKARARTTVFNAINAGKLKRGVCTVCSFSPAEAHHEDYNQPLVIKWLCKLHHEEYHKKHSP